MDAVAQPKPCLFTKVALDVRLCIYQSALKLNTNDHKYGEPSGKTWCYNLASTCRQLRGEFLPLILETGMTRVKTDDKLTTWIRDSPLSMRPHIRHLKLSFSKKYCRILEKLPTCSEGYAELPPELKVMLQQRQGSLITLDSDVPSDSQLALDRITSIWNAVRCFPNIKVLWIHVGGLSEHSLESEFSAIEFQASLLLRIMSFTFPDLQHLELEMNIPPLLNLKHFHQLRSLQFSGYSKTSPNNTLSTLQSLKHLESFKIKQHPRELEYAPPHTLNSRPEPFRDLVMTPEIISRMNPLKNITINSTFDIREASLWYSVPLTRALMDAFLVHSQSLQSLKICQTFFHPHLKKDVFEILDFAHNSPIPHVYLHLKLPPPLSKTLDPKDFLPPSTGKRMDVVLYYNHLEVRTGRYLPSASEMEERRIDIENHTFDTTGYKLRQYGF